MISQTLDFYFGGVFFVYLQKNGDDNNGFGYFINDNDAHPRCILVV